jgi:thiosulfate/3-mercaptopyruvate sulfurtransferase
MRMRLLTLSFAALSMLAPGFASSSGQQPDPSARGRLVVSAAWLRQHAADPNLVLLHVGNRTTYDAGHLPGARYVDGSTLSISQSPEGLTLEMLPAPVLRENLAALGVSDTSHVVVYESDGMWAPSTRVMLALDYAGLARVSWLDGGQNAWVAAGGPLTAAVPPVTRGRLSPLTLHAVVVDAAFVKAHLHQPGYAIVDARSPAFYDGTRTGGRPPQEHKTGHIAGAISVPYDSFTTGDAVLKPQEQIAAAFDKAGVKAGDTVVAYCHIGQQATATLFAARILGHRVLLYDGSFEDWSRRDLPVDGPAAKR